MCLESAAVNKYCYSSSGKSDLEDLLQFAVIYIP